MNMISGIFTLEKSPSLAQDTSMKELGPSKLPRAAKVRVTKKQLGGKTVKVANPESLDQFDKFVHRTYGKLFKKLA
jgi:hypothetical protein